MTQFFHKFYSTLHSRNMWLYILIIKVNGQLRKQNDILSSKYNLEFNLHLWLCNISLIVVANCSVIGNFLVFVAFSLIYSFLVSISVYCYQSKILLIENIIRCRTIMYVNQSNWNIMDIRSNILDMSPSWKITVLQRQVLDDIRYDIRHCQVLNI